MKIYFINGESIKLEEKLAKVLKHKFDDNVGRQSSVGFIEIYNNGDLYFALNKSHVLYVK